MEGATLGALKAINESKGERKHSHAGPRRRRKKKKEAQGQGELEASQGLQGSQGYPGRRLQWQEEWFEYRQEEFYNNQITIIKEETMERDARRAWAVMELEKERRAQTIESYVNSVTKTTWFTGLVSVGLAELRSDDQKAESTAMDDYEVVCPFFRAGCRAKVFRRELAEHLSTCEYNPFAVDKGGEQDSKEKVTKRSGLTDYEVVCPNSVRGCNYTGSVLTIKEHLAVCSLRVKSREEEDEDRREIRRQVIEAVEIERSRRLEEHVSAGKNRVHPVESFELFVLHQHFSKQVDTALARLHEQIARAWDTHRQADRRLKGTREQLVCLLSQEVRDLWPFSTLEVIGSVASGTSAGGSDVDIVICFSDQAQGLLGLQGALILVLSQYLSNRAISTGVFSSTNFKVLKVLPQARVPLIKAAMELNGRDFQVDISIDGDRNTGLISTACINTLLRHLPPLAPVFTSLKAYLRSKHLNDSYTGGLGSYALFVLVLVSVLRMSREGGAKTTAPASEGVAAVSPSGEAVEPEATISPVASPSAPYTDIGITDGTQRIGSKLHTWPPPPADRASAVGKDIAAAGQERGPGRSPGTKRHPSSWIRSKSSDTLPAKFELGLNAHISTPSSLPAEESPSRRSSGTLTPNTPSSRSRSSSIGAQDMVTVTAASATTTTTTATTSGNGKRRKPRSLPPSSWIAKGSLMLKHMGSPQSQSHSQLSGHSQPPSYYQYFAPQGGHGSDADSTDSAVSYSSASTTLSMPVGAPVGVGAPLSMDNHTWENVLHKKRWGRRIAISLLRGESQSAAMNPPPELQPRKRFPATGSFDQDLTPPRLAVPPSPRTSFTAIGRSVDSFEDEEEDEEKGELDTRGGGKGGGGSRFLNPSSPSYGTFTETFLRYIGEGNILGRHGYSARAGGFRFQINAGGASATGVNYNGAMLVVEDPCTPENNLSGHTYKMSEVQKALNDALESLRRGAVRSDPQMDIFSQSENDVGSK